MLIKLPDLVMPEGLREHLLLATPHLCREDRSALVGGRCVGDPPDTIGVLFATQPLVEKALGKVVRPVGTAMHDCDAGGRLLERKGPGWVVYVTLFSDAAWPVEILDDYGKWVEFAPTEQTAVLAAGRHRRQAFKGHWNMTLALLYALD